MSGNLFLAFAICSYPLKPVWFLFQKTLWFIVPHRRLMFCNPSDVGLFKKNKNWLAIHNLLAHLNSQNLKAWRKVLRRPVTGLPLTYGWQERGSCTLVCYDLVYRNSAFPFGWLNNHLDGLGFALFFIGLLHLFVCMCMCVGTLEIRGQLCCLCIPKIKLNSVT